VVDIGVVGTGYAGLVVGACLAEYGNSVVCVDSDPEKVGRLRKGEIPIYEPGLEELVPRNVAEERLRFSSDLAEAVRSSRVLFIAVGTPQDEDGSADLTHVLAVARGIAEAMDGYKVIVNKSTVPVGTAARVRELVGSLTEHPFSVVSNPEFLKEGSAVDDFLKPDRVVIGTDEAKAERIMRQVYEPFVRTGKPILVMGPASAELTKYAANAMLATRISFMNEIANYCDRIGADVKQVRMGIGSDARIGASFLFPGVGYGGSCFPKDVKALIRMGHGAGMSFEVVEAVDRANARQKAILVPRIAEHLGGLRGKVVALWGLAFKPRTDDMREAPSLTIIDRLLAEGASVRAYDPKAEASARRCLGTRITYCERAYEAVTGADALVVATEWAEFREPDFPRIKELMRHPAVFDGRNLYDPDLLRQLGFHYEGVGRR
jgi:UDPglucose 6-dehydrogenase